MKRQEVQDYARTFLNVPFAHEGRDEKGLDCAGLVIITGRKWITEYEDMSGYARAPIDPKFIRSLRKQLKSVPRNLYRPGLIGVFRQSIFPCHIGIFGERNGTLTLINSRADRKRVVEEDFIDGEFMLTDLLAYPGLEDL